MNRAAGAATGHEQSDEKLRLELDAPAIPLPKLAAATDAFSHLVDAVTKELHPDAKTAIEWTVEVEPGSIVLAAQPAVRREAAWAMVNAVVDGLDAMEKGPAQPPHFSDRALEYARNLAAVAGDDLTVRVRNGHRGTRLTPRLVTNVDDLTVGAPPRLGTIEGRLEELNIHGQPSFQIWERLTGRMVQCKAGDKVTVERLERAMGRRVAVRGTIRASKTGIRQSVEVKQLRVFPSEDELPSADEVRGILKAS